MDTVKLTASVTAVADLLSAQFGNDDLALLAALLMQLGDTLASVVSQRSECDCVSSNKKKTGGDS